MLESVSFEVPGLPGSAVQDQGKQPAEFAQLKLDPSVHRTALNGDRRKLFSIPNRSTDHATVKL